MVASITSMWVAILGIFFVTNDDVDICLPSATRYWCSKVSENNGYAEMVSLDLPLIVKSVPPIEVFGI